MNEMDEAVTSVAIVGMHGRFPGSPSLQEFWNNLCCGKEAIRAFSPEELAASGLDTNVLSNPSYVNAGADLEDSEMFDAGFFGFSAREAEILDPQRRVFLESVWHALEDAGYDPHRFSGPIAVFSGSSFSSYFQHVADNLDLRSAVNAFQILIGNDKDHLATQTAYKLNLRGPALTVQTACSTSLVTVCLAYQSLLNFECDLAVAGGVSIKLPQCTGYFYEPDGIVSPDGHCRAFDVNAAGTVGGNGVGTVVLKRLTEALRDGDRIRAVIRGAAVNNDGCRKVSYTAPSVEGQAAVIANALAIANISAETIGYVEAHGTATPLGDPVEIAALTQAFRYHTRKKNICAVGSVKSNIGHLDAAAGIASLIKAVLCLEHGKLVPSLHFHEANPALNLAESPFYVQTELADWKRNGQPRRAGVSSFGIGGTNAHVVLEQAPAVVDSGTSRIEQILPLSARTKAALQRATLNLEKDLRRNPHQKIADVAYTLAVGRRSFRHRRFVLAKEMEEALANLAHHEPTNSGVAGESVETVFLFPGQGSQHHGMARELYNQEPVFRKELDSCAEILRPCMGKDIRRLLYEDGDDEQLRETTFAQPLLFSVQYALARSLMHWGVIPHAMIGHSLGEYVAACLAGVFSLDQALRLITVRAMLMQRSAPGAMLAVAMAEDEAKLFLTDELSLAAVNGARQCVIAGTEAAIGELESLLDSRGQQGTRIHTSKAFHSTLMDPILGDFHKYVAQFQMRAPYIPFLSNLSGSWQGDAATQPEYWVQHLRCTVRFSDNVTELRKRKNLVCVEVGPASGLVLLVKSQPADNSITVIETMRRRHETKSDVECLARAIGQLWLAGVDVNWNAYFANENRHRVSLPGYPFERQKFSISAAQPLGAAQDVLTKSSDVNSWFYLPAWRQTVAPTADLDPASYLLFLDDENIGQEVIEKLKAHGSDITTVKAGNRFRSENERSFVIRRNVWEDYLEVLQAMAENGRAVRTILHLWNIGKSNTDATRRLHDLICFAKALTRQPQRFRLVIASTGLQSVNGLEEIDAEKATILGACRVIPMECPNVDVCSLDIEWPGPHAIGQLCAELVTGLSDAAEEVIAYRGRRRWVQTVEPVTVPEKRKVPLREKGVYLITGGLGGIGLTLGRHLATEYRARLVLVGRRHLEESSPEWREIRTLENAGAEILVCTANVAEPTQMATVIEQTRLRFGNLNGVIHAAGVARHSLISEETLDSAAEVLAAKVTGTLVLHDLLKSSELDFFVCFSSLSTILGGIGECEYTAANAFLDAYAQRESRRLDRLTMSINWDGWTEVGMSIRNATAEELEHDRNLMNAIRPAEGILAFRMALALDQPQICISTMPLAARIDQVRMFIRSFTGDGETGSHNGHSYPRPELSTQFLPPCSATEESLATIWSDLLGVQQVGRNDNFFELGGHSLLAMQMTARVRKLLGVDIPLRLLFENASIATIASQIDGKALCKSDASTIAIKPVSREAYRQPAG